MTTTSFGQPACTTVKVTFTPAGIFITLLPLIVPALVLTLEPLIKVKFTLYVLPSALHVGPLTLIAGFSHGSVQSAGLVAITLVTHDPSVAVNIKFVPIGILMIVLPLTVPVFLVKLPAPSHVKLTLYVPVPVHTG